MGAMVRVAAARAEAELEHAHTGHAAVVPQADGLGSQQAQVLGDDRPPAQRLVDRPEQRLAGGAHPSAELGRLAAGSNRPDAPEPQEMVDAHRVEEAERSGQAIDPPLEAVALVCRPVVLLVAPELAGL